MDGYDLAREVTDDAFGPGTYADMNADNPNPGVQRAIRRGVGAWKPPTREEQEDFSDAHAEGLHEGLPRDGCPDCEGR